jgi:hypothetical protein
MNRYRISGSPIPQWGYIISELEKRAQEGNRLAYIHVVEPRVSGYLDSESFYWKQRVLPTHLERKPH